ncbi:TIGR00303 family protein [Ancylothrix sp. C2]|uniref:nicotinate mononucleotide-dependent phosphoribosyltransferase CobT n=1 Tax=Ancylothrix sp. D3o TaxID=2953691 RepID=UPI0021BA7403|nr:TIGR00303 family protein [Ancylothrix sp. D3o]MCT7949634.1 TIGR00303 family protein [Ancylothrix sp. D3o]
MLQIYTELEKGLSWVKRYRGCRPAFACILGFTETGLIPHISAAGATPEDRRYTAIADAEFLYNGPQPNPSYPLPPLDTGISPVLISRAVLESQNIPSYLFNAGLPIPPTVPAIDLGGKPARCLTTGNALEISTVKHLFQQGLLWGEKLAQQHPYLIIGECVVGGTTTALALLTALSIPAAGKVNSSHPTCNHKQKWQIVTQGFQNSINLKPNEPFNLVAAVGDPMQITVAGMAISASRKAGVLLAGGTQMLAVYALLQKIALTYPLDWRPESIVVGTTRWVAEDPTGDTVGLARSIPSVSLLATQLSFAHSAFSGLQAYEKGFVKEGTGAGGCAIAAHLYQNWNQTQLLDAIEALNKRTFL